MARGFTGKSFELLEGLAANNEREWFHAHKSDIETHLREPFAALLEALTNRLSDAPRPLMGGAKTMFRMNRDVRFSEDKSPYKTAVSGMLTASGAKAEGGGVLYLQIDVEGGFMGSGFHMLSPKQLGPFRDAMIARADEWDDVLARLDAAGRTLDGENSLTSMPRGYAEHDGHRHAASIKLKSLLLREDLPKIAWTSGDVVDRAERLARDAMPLLTFERPG